MHDTLDIALNYEAQAAHEERMLTKGVERYESNAEFAQRNGDLSKAETSLNNGRSCCDAAL